MKLIVGLGNPGKKYIGTRHNVGFGLVNYYCQVKNLRLKKKKFNGIYYKENDFILATPKTFMNLSGDFVNAITKFFKIDPSDVLVLLDDMNLPPGKILMKPKGSAGGQNGMKDIISKMGTQDIPRLKIGIGRGKDAISHVLGQVTKQEYTSITQTFDKATKAINMFIKGDTEKAIMLCNTRTP